MKNFFGKFTGSFLNDFDPDNLISGFRSKEFRGYTADEFIFGENDVTDKIFFVLKGKIGLRKSPCEDDECPNCYQKGDIVGLEDALTEGKFSFSAYSLTNTYVILVKTGEFIDMIKKNRELNLWILKYLNYRISMLK